MAKWKPIKFLTVILACFNLVSGATFATEYGNLAAESDIPYSKQLKSIKRGESARVQISDRHLNRLITPFKSPSIKMDSIEGISYKTVDNVVYVSTNKDQPIGMFITERGDELTSVSLVLEPMPIAPQEVNIDTITDVFSSLSARQFEQSQPYLNTVKEVLRTLALGEIPRGYSASTPNGFYFPFCYQEGLEFDFQKGQFFEGGDFVVSVGTIRNKSPIEIEFRENNCGSKYNGQLNQQVVAVSAFPRVLLLPNQKTEIYVMQRKDIRVNDTRKRRSLVGL